VKIYNLTESVPIPVKQCILQLARAYAPKLVGSAIGSESPLLALAEAEVHELLVDILVSIDHPQPVQIEAMQFWTAAGVIVAIDETTDDGVFAGFLQYKARLPHCDSASIGYAAVSDNYKGQGVFKSMLNELRSIYPALGLDCTMDLVPMYEKLGFQVSGQQGVHVAMVTAPLSGKHWARDQQYLDRTNAVQAARQWIEESLGDKATEAYARCESDTTLLIEQVRDFVRSRMAADSLPIEKPFS
jgi:ribosomal protein S18 acetylase RimI-like enzyme